MSRAFWRAWPGLVVAVCMMSPLASWASDTLKVHLIGTGGPELTPTRRECRH